VKTIASMGIDVLLMSGDVFDVSNPAASSVTLFYTFLKEATTVRPGLQIIIIAGNHDSAARLEAPKPLLDSFNIHIVGKVERLTDGKIDYEKLIIPIKDKAGEIKAWCIAVPFLRLGDYPIVPDAVSPYAEGIMEVYKEAYQFASALKQPGQAILAMGHLHTLNAEISENDKSERLILGGVEFIPVTAFHKDIVYTALGHIHKAQKIAGQENIRYAGSPLPMSFSELNYRHQLMMLELEGEEMTNIRIIEIPVTVELLRIPSIPKPLNEVLLELNQLPGSINSAEQAPYLEVRVLLDGPEPSLRYKIETALENKQVRLAKIEVRYPSTNNTDNNTELTDNQLPELEPINVFMRIYQSRFNKNVPEEILSLFNQVSLEASTKE
jgi:exonuclease SbcD